MQKILVTAIGSFSADIIIKKLHQDGHFVVGTDIYPREWVVDAQNVDKFYQIPKPSETEEYIRRLLEICEENEIGFLFPLTDPEIDVLNLRRDRFRRLSVQICMSDYETITICRNKRKTENFLRSANVCTLIDSYDLKRMESADISYPIVCKPVNGRSSQGVKIFDDAKQLFAFYDRIDPETYLFQPLIAGNVIAVDVVRDPSNNCCAVARRELTRTLSGAGISVQVFRDRALEENCKKIAELLNVTGCVNFEFIEADDDKSYFLECNPRFSGGVEFSVLAGYDFVTNHLKCFRNEAIETTADIREHYISRKYEEYITDQSS